MKAVLYLQGERNIRGHATWELVRRISEHDPDFQELSSQAKRLDKFYITARYPDGLPSGTPHEYFEAEEAQEAIEAAMRVLSLVEKKWGADDEGANER